MKQPALLHVIWVISAAALLGGCTVKAVGDPNRPITINAHITLDIKGLEKTANNIEDYVSGGTDKAPAGSQGGK